MYGGNYPAPAWFWEGLSGYWKWPPHWLSLPELPGAVAAQSQRSADANDSTGGGSVINDYAPNILFPSDRYANFKVGSQLPLILEVEADFDTEVHLFLVNEGNESYLGEMDLGVNAGDKKWFTYTLNEPERTESDLTEVGTNIIYARVYPVGTFDLAAKEAAAAAEAAAEEAGEEAAANGETLVEDENATEYVDPSIGLTSIEIDLDAFTGSLAPRTSLISPPNGFSTTSLSTIRLEALASDPDGNLEGVTFYVDGNALPSWYGYLNFANFDLTNADGTLLTIDDGTDRNQTIIFEFDQDGAVFGGGAPAITGSTWNQLDDLSVDGNFSHAEPATFVVEIDSTEGTVDTFRWSKDGGQTFVDEKVDITGSSQSLSYGLNVTFGATTGHGLGDRWTFIGRPANIIVPIAQQGGDSSRKQRTRDSLLSAIEQQRQYGLLSMRTSTKGSTHHLYLYHLMDRLIDHAVDVNGSSLTTNVLSRIYLDDNITSRRENAYGGNQHPFGVTWQPDAGNHYIYAIAFDELSGNHFVSKPVFVTSTQGVGMVPEVELAEVTREMLYTGTAQDLSLSAVATDGDGVVEVVRFYVNGELVGMDTSSPYEANYDMNGSGIYEVYAVASDDDGNDITSTIQRIKVLEPGDFVEPLTLTADSTTYLGGVADVSALYKSADGSYDAGIKAYVYVNGQYAGEADMLPRTEPGVGEDDPGQGFTFDLNANAVGSQEVEFVIVNGDETATATVYVNVDESPLTDDLEFIRALYQGLYYREPLGFELGEFYNRLKAGELTREQLIEELRDRGEFVKARDILLSHKSFDGEWDTIANALDKVETNPYSSSASLDRPDDPGTPGAGNFVSMNEVVSARIEVPNDIDYFRIQSLGSGRNGLLTITLLAGHPGASISELSKPLYARGPSGFVTFGTIAPWDPSGEGYSRSGTSTVSYDLRNFEGGEDWYFEFYIKGNAIETGSYTLGSFQRICSGK